MADLILLNDSVKIGMLGEETLYIPTDPDP